MRTLLETYFRRSQIPEWTSGPFPWHLVPRSVSPGRLLMSEPDYGNSLMLTPHNPQLTEIVKEYNLPLVANIPIILISMVAPR